MICCNGNCKQGRICPNRKHKEASIPAWVLILLLILLSCFVGRLDYDAALVTEQISNSAASNGR